MRPHILFSIILSMFCLSTSGQDADHAKQILITSLEACQQVKNGYYEMEHHMKYMSGPDTSTKVYKCYFEKLPEDTLFAAAFHYETPYEGKYSTHIMYTGAELVRYSMKDSTGNIMSNSIWADEIQAIKHNFTFYDPLFRKKSYPLPNEETLQNEKNLIEYLGETNIRDIPCYHIRINFDVDQWDEEILKTIKAENHYWIRKSDYIPIQYSVAYDMVMNNDTMSQYQRDVLTTYELNHLNQEPQLTIQSIPYYVYIEDHQPYERPELLADGTEAPEWSLLDLEDNTVSLADLKGKLVLVDFFYKSCYPCMLALPKLQELHERYKNQGLVILGVNPYDTKEKDDIHNFLAKRGITFPVLLGANEVSKQYHVSGYPTTYLIDKDGTIILSKVGYGETAFDAIEVEIQKRL